MKQINCSDSDVPQLSIVDSIFMGKVAKFIEHTPLAKQSMQSLGAVLVQMP